MKFRMKFAEQITGLFILAAIGALAVILILMGPNQRIFKKSYYFYTYFNSAQGLSRGQEIRFKGVKIGLVDSFGMEEDDYVIKMTFHIYEEEVARIKGNSVIELKSNLLNIGGGLVMYTDQDMEVPILDAPGNFEKGTKKEPIYIPSRDTEEGRDLIINRIVDVESDVDVINDTIAKVQNAITYIEDFAFEASNLIRDSRENINKSLANIEDLTNDIKDADGLIPRLLDDEDGFYDQITDTAGDLKEIVRLTSYDLDRILDDISNSVKNLKNLTEGIKEADGLIPTLVGDEGTVGTLFNDNNKLYDKLYDDISDILEKVDTAVQQLKEFSTYINSTSPQISTLIEEGKSALGEGRDVLEGISNNPLIRGGISEQDEQQTTFQSFRDEDF